MQTLQKTTSIMPFTDYETGMKWAELISKSDLCPTTYKNKPGNIILAVEYGKPLGLNLLQCLTNIAVINGRPSVWGDAMLALAMSHPHYEYHEETIDYSADKKPFSAKCIVKRKNLRVPIVSEFTMDDAIKAGIIGNAVWKTYPKRMLQMRARGFALRDAFPDLLLGIITREEAEDCKEIKPRENIEVVTINGELVHQARQRDFGAEGNPQRRSEIIAQSLGEEDTTSLSETSSNEAHHKTGEEIMTSINQHHAASIEQFKHEYADFVRQEKKV